MRVTINGTEEAIADGMTVGDLLRAQNRSPRQVAVEVNEEVILRADYDGAPLRAGDRIEIVTFVGGG